MQMNVVEKHECSTQLNGCWTAAVQMFIEYKSEYFSYTPGADTLPIDRKINVNLAMLSTL